MLAALHVEKIYVVISIVVTRYRHVEAGAVAAAAVAAAALATGLSVQCAHGFC